MDPGVAAAVARAEALQAAIPWTIFWCSLGIVAVLALLVTIMVLSAGGTTIETNQALICPHCGTKGQVHTAQIRQDVGISSGKVAAAVVTNGWSLLATGLTRKEWVTQAHCLHCDSTWTF